MTVIDSTWNWRQISSVDNPLGRGYSSMAYAGPGKVLLFAGNVTDPGSRQENDTWILDSADDQWVQQSPDTVPTIRQEHALVHLGGKVYCVGGINSAITYFDETLAYDLGTGDWSTVTSAVSPFTNDGSLNYPQGRSYNGVLLTTDGTDLICIVPTTNLAGKGNSVWRMVIGSDWANEVLSAELPSYTAFPAGLFVGDRFVFFGGVVGNVITKFYDLVSTSWVNRPAAEVYPRRRNHVAIWTGDQMFFYGGEVFPIGGGSPTAYGDQWLYDPVAVAMTELTTDDTPGLRSRYAMAWDGNRVVLFGGTATPDANPWLGDTWVLEPPPVSLVTEEPEEAVCHTAILKGTVGPTTIETDVYFDWGTTIAYGNTVSMGTQPPTGIPVEFTTEIGGLTPGSTYHYRIRAVERL